MTKVEKMDVKVILVVHSFARMEKINQFWLVLQAGDSDVDNQTVQEYGQKYQHMSIGYIPKWALNSWSEMFIKWPKQYLSVNFMT